MPTVLMVLTGVYVLVMAGFLISENRRPQATLAWLLVLWVAPGLGLIVYILFGRDWKALSKQSTLRRQELKPAAMLLLAPLLSRQDAKITRLEAWGGGHQKLMMLIRWNSYSALTRRNRVEILQNAAAFYPPLVLMPMQRLSGGSASRESMPEIVQNLMLDILTFNSRRAPHDAGEPILRRRLLREFAAPARISRAILNVPGFPVPGQTRCHPEAV